MSLERSTEGFPLAALREINLLKRLKHKNIVQILDIATAKFSSQDCSNLSTKAPFSYPYNFFMVCEYMEHSLKGLLTRGYTFTTEEIRNIMVQILEGLIYLHSHFIMHRDIKSSNILVNAAGEVKLADFGMGTFFDPKLLHNSSKGVVTLLYRAPELLYNQEYKEAIDMWSLGCVLGEMLSGTPIFNGGSEEEQISQIESILGNADKTPQGMDRSENCKSSKLKQKVCKGH
jgi:serine/threonine protein kinase